ncbi:hypothetical protein LBMAG27_01360 [Bacteroidota bacterium]|nr:hypothetical protein LBMAG27_01360 [Bacteroidota bacterium]
MLNFSTLVSGTHIILKMKNDEEGTDNPAKTFDFYLKKKNRRPRSKTLKKFKKSAAN